MDIEVYGIDAKDDAKLRGEAQDDAE